MFIIQVKWKRFSSFLFEFMFQGKLLRLLLQEDVFTSLLFEGICKQGNWFKNEHKRLIFLKKIDSDKLECKLL